MAEGILRSIDSELEVFSAGTFPAPQVQPRAIQVLKEIGIDISSHKPKSVDQFISRSFDVVVTVCDDAKESCPSFQGKVRTRIHIGFEDPSFVTGSDEYVLSQFRRVRDQIRERFQELYRQVINPGLI